MAANLCHLGGEMEPATPDRLERLLDELDAADDEHFDVSVSDESGWTLSAFAGGLLVWENVEDDEGPRHREGVTRSEVLGHFRTLVSGELDPIHSLPWSPGYS